MGVTMKEYSVKKIVRYIIPVLIFLLLSLTFCFSIQAQETNLTKNFGIGAHGATPAFGGVSLRYNGLAPIYLQTVGRFILSDEIADHMVGAGVSYAIFEHKGKWSQARLYFTLEGGWRYNKETDIQDETSETTTLEETTTLAAGIAFGGELVFSFGGIPLGLNIGIGQGIGRENANSQSKGLAGVYVAAGIHAYF
jgi:hypothetical protein